MMSYDVTAVLKACYLVQNLSEGVDLTKEFLDSNKLHGLVGRGWSNTNIPVGSMVKISIGEKFGIYTIKNLVDKSNVQAETVLPVLQLQSGDAVVPADGEDATAPLDMRDAAYFLSYSKTNEQPISVVVVGKPSEKADTETSNSMTPNNAGGPKLSEAVEHEVKTRDGVVVRGGDTVFIPSEWAISTKGKNDSVRQATVDEKNPKISVRNGNNLMTYWTSETYSSYSALQRDWHKINWTKEFLSPPEVNMDKYDRSHTVNNSPEADRIQQDRAYKSNHDYLVKTGAIKEGMEYSDVDSLTLVQWTKLMDVMQYKWDITHDKNDLEMYENTTRIYQSFIRPHKNSKDVDFSENEIAKQNINSWLEDHDIEVEWKRIPKQMGESISGAISDTPKLDALSTEQLKKLVMVLEADDNNKEMMGMSHVAYVAWLNKLTQNLKRPTKLEKGQEVSARKLENWLGSHDIENEVRKLINRTNVEV